MAAPRDPKKEVWRCQLFRSLVNGDLDVLERVAASHPTAIHERFTNRMLEWMIEPETFKWQEFIGCTAIFVAAAHAQAEAVEWLLAHGADPSVAAVLGGGIGPSANKPMLLAADIVGQCLRAPVPESLTSIERVLGEKRRTLPAPPAPRISIKCHWYSWTERIPYALSRYRVDMDVKATWHGNPLEMYLATVKRVNEEPAKTYKLSYEPDEGYYSARTGLQGDILYKMMDGKMAPPVIDEYVHEDQIRLRDGTEPKIEQRFKTVLFTQLRAKLDLEWSAFWIPPTDVQHQLRYRQVGDEWTNVKLNVPHHTLIGLFLNRKYEFQVRCRNAVGWSDLSPKVKITTPPKRKQPRSVYPHLDNFGYREGGRSMLAALPDVEIAKPGQYPEIEARE